MRGWSKFFNNYLTNGKSFCGDECTSVKLYLRMYERRSGKTCTAGKSWRNQNSHVFVTVIRFIYLALISRLFNFTTKEKEREEERYRARTTSGWRANWLNHLSRFLLNPLIDFNATILLFIKRRGTYLLFREIWLNCKRFNYRKLSIYYLATRYGAERRSHSFPTFRGFLAGNSVVCKVIIKRTKEVDSYGDIYRKGEIKKREKKNKRCAIVGICTQLLILYHLVKALIKPSALFDSYFLQTLSTANSVKVPASRKNENDEISEKEK